jgi:hypothetical protein
MCAADIRGRRRACPPPACALKTVVEKTTLSSCCSIEYRIAPTPRAASSARVLHDLVLAPRTGVLGAHYTARDALADLYSVRRSPTVAQSSGCHGSERYAHADAAIER